MRKLTKTINRRRKNYKPTIGLTSKDGSYRKSVNATVYYIKLQKKRDAEAKREARKFLMNFLEKEMPGLFGVLNAFGNLGMWMY